jgi:hypothetical protein
MKTHQHSATLQVSLGIIAENKAEIKESGVWLCTVHCGCVTGYETGCGGCDSLCIAGFWRRGCSAVCFILILCCAVFSELDGSMSSLCCGEDIGW